jgi:hypothetical protein
MALDDEVTLVAGDWTQLTTGAPTGPVTLQIQSNYVVLRSSVAKPAVPAKGLRYTADRGQVFLKIAEVFPGGPTGGNLWAYSTTAGKAWVSYA